MTTRQQRRALECADQKAPIYGGAPVVQGDEDDDAPATPEAAELKSLIEAMDKLHPTPESRAAAAAAESLAHELVVTARAKYGGAQGRAKFQAEVDVIADGFAAGCDTVGGRNLVDTAWFVTYVASAIGADDKAAYERFLLRASGESGARQ